VSAIILLVLRILLAGLLYGFLGLVIYTLLRDLKQQGDLLASRQPPLLILTTALDSHRFSRQYDKPEVILGREPGCDFLIDDKTVSSRHARLSYHHQQWWLEDLASTNGTFLNDEAISAPVVITQGDELRLGHIELSVQIGQSENSHSA
jgi:pSer/pThr/pTyr-binding forkhead associated (FHA) protein